MKKILKAYFLIMFFLLCLFLGVAGAMTAGANSNEAIYGETQEQIRLRTDGEVGAELRIADEIIFSFPRVP